MQKMDTKTRILDTAERLFAQKGFDAVSLRNIIASAKVNLAAVHYHFGSKQALVHAAQLRDAILQLHVHFAQLQHRHVCAPPWSHAGTFYLAVSFDEKKK